MRIAAAIMVLAALAVFILPGSGLCRGDMWYCDSYGVECWKKADNGFMMSLISPDGDFLDAIYLKDGNCLCFTAFGCLPCDEKLREVDWDKVCNEWFTECEGQCFAKKPPNLP